MANASIRSLVSVLASLTLLLGCSSAVDPSSMAGTPEAARERVVAFQTSDGFRLEGTLFGNSEEAAILAHMYPADQRSWQPFAQRLAKEGFTALTFNFRGYGISEGEKEIAKIDRDMGAAVAFLRARGMERIYLVGASMGGAASVIVGNSQEIAGIVFISGSRAFRGLDASEAIGSLRVPALFIASADDGNAKETAQWFADSSPSPAAAKSFSGSAHGTALLEGPHQETVERLLLDFLKDPDGTIQRLMEGV